MMTSFTMPPQDDTSRSLDDILHALGLEDLLETMPDALVIVDQSGKILHANAEASRLFGYTRTHLRGLPIEGLVPERFRHQHAGDRRRYFLDPRTRPMGLGLALFGRRSDGSEFPVEISLSPVHTKAGTFAMAAVRDTTERIAAAERARQLESEQAARKAAEEALRIRDTFISVAAHELKTPVTTIRAFTQFLERDIARRGDVDPKLLAKALARLDGQTAKLSRLITQLLDVARIQSGRLVLDIADIDLVEVAREAMDALSVTMDESRLRLHALGPLAMRGDRIRLEQVLTNVIDNALKYSPADTRVDIGIKSHGAFAVLHVRDAGPGVPPEHRGQIFDPFYRVASPARQVGIGLGLFISKQIVDQHGGEITATYPSEGGMVVTVRLPIHSPSLTPGATD